MQWYPEKTAENHETILLAYRKEEKLGAGEFYAEYLLPSGGISAIIGGIIDKYTIELYAAGKVDIKEV